MTCFKLRRWVSSQGAFVREFLIKKLSINLEKYNLPLRQKLQGYDEFIRTGVGLCKILGAQSL